MPRLIGAEIGSERMAVDGVARKVQVVYYWCGKKGHYRSKCGEGERIRILELEKEIEELKGKGEQ